MPVQMLSVEAIRLDERCQPRAAINPEIIDEYADAMAQGAEFPPLTVYRDGSTFFLADGFHRIAAARQVGHAHIVCDVTPGTIRDAILHAVGANATHGQRRTNLDKRRAVETLLKDDEWSGWSDSEIARRCGVHHSTVAAARSSLANSASEPTSERTYTDRYGNTRTMNTANIGKSAKSGVVADSRDSGDKQPAVTDEYAPNNDDNDLPYAEVVDPSDPASFLEPMAPPKRETFIGKDDSEINQEIKGLMPKLEAGLRYLARPDFDEEGLAAALETLPNNSHGAHTLAGVIRSQFGDDFAGLLKEAL